MRPVSGPCSCLKLVPLLMGPLWKSFRPHFKKHGELSLRNWLNQNPRLTDSMDTYNSWRRFSHAPYEVPYRVVTPDEALRLSGLETHWKRTSIHDAENLPDNRIRDMCGNSFHTALVCSALGETSILGKWIQGKEEQNQNAPATRVATKAEAHAVYADLVDKVASRFAKDYPNKPPPNNRTLPDLPDCQPALANEEKPIVAERQLPVYRKIKVTKENREAQYRRDAAAKVLTEAESAALETAELAWVFESLRAAVHVPFDFPNLVRVLWGFSNLQHAACKLPDFPDF